MSDELESRLAETLALLPGPSPVAEARARTAALDALPQPRGRSLWPRAVVAVAAVVALLGAGAAALAALGTIHVGVGRERARTPIAAPRLLLPAGARGIAVVAGGELWLTTRAGTRIEGLPVTAAELSPRALYVAAGIGRSLVVMRPDGRQAWAHDAGGRVEAIAWAPSGFRLAYVVRRASGTELRTIEGDGDHDRLLDDAVRGVRPSWRADSLALAYVAAGGRAVVYDLSHRSRRLVDTRLCAGAVTRVAFAPAGSRLALGGAHAVYVEDRSGTAARCVELGPAPVRALAWAGATILYSTGSDVRSLLVSTDGEPFGAGSVSAPRDVSALGSAGGSMLVAALDGGEVALVAGPRTWSSSVRRLPARSVLLRLRGRASVESVAVR